MWSCRQVYWSWLTGPFCLMTWEERYCIRSATQLQKVRVMEKITCVVHIPVNREVRYTKVLSLATQEIFSLSPFLS